MHRNGLEMGEYMVRGSILLGVSTLALCVAGPAFAQSNSTATQTGTNGQATINQDGTGVNTSTISQAGSDDTMVFTRPRPGV